MGSQLERGMVVTQQNLFASLFKAITTYLQTDGNNWGEVKFGIAGELVTE